MPMVLAAPLDLRDAAREGIVATLVSGIARRKRVCAVGTLAQLALQEIAGERVGSVHRRVRRGLARAGGSAFGR